MLSQAVRWLTERRLASFSGGIRPPRQTERTLRSRVMATPIPQRLFMPLTTYSKQERLTPVVRIGESVRKYQCLATHLQDPDLILHAPTSGMITAISRDTLEIQSDGLDQALTLRGNTTEKDHASSHPSKHRPGGYRRARRRRISNRKKNPARGLGWSKGFDCQCC